MLILERLTNYCNPDRGTGDVGNRKWLNDIN